MRKTTILLIISVLVVYYAIPVMAQKVKKKYNLPEIQKAHWRESRLLRDDTDIPLTTPYYPPNSADEETILNGIISYFQVNENSGFSSAWQTNPSISTDGSGNFIIAWQDQRNGNLYHQNVYAQRFSSDGTAQGSNFKVNEIPVIIQDAWQVYPSLSADDSGNFIITWGDGRNGNFDIYAQRYSSDGTAVGSNFKVSDDQGIARQRLPSISVDGTGNFTITWVDERNSTEDDIYAQRYSSDGTALGINFKVNDEDGITEQFYPEISADDSGNFVIVWEDLRNGVWSYDIYAQRYSMDGTVLDSNFKVNDDLGDAMARTPSISVDCSGNFIIAWWDGRNPIADCDWYEDIYAQRYSSDGIALDSNFQVNDDQGCAIQWFSSIATDSSGNFIIAWQDERNGYDQPDIYAQRYLSNGTDQGSNFKVNDDQGEAWQNSPSISADDSGNFIIAWQDHRNGDGDIYVQRYSSDGTALESNFKVNDDPVGISDNELSEIPTEFVLHQNYPNPFNPSTTIEFNLPKSELVTLKVYNILGEEIATLVNNRLKSGNHNYQFDGSNFASGVYLYRIEAGEFSDVKKMVILH